MIEIDVTNEMDLRIKKGEIYKLNNVKSFQHTGTIGTIFWSLEEFSDTNRGAAIKRLDERVFTATKTIYVRSNDDAASLHLRSNL